MGTATLGSHRGGTETGEPGEGLPQGSDQAVGEGARSDEIAGGGGQLQDPGTLFI